MSTGIVVFAHGSRVEAANQAVHTVARQLADSTGIPQVEAAFLELATPDLPGAAEKLAQAGVSNLIVLPYFLTPGLHMERDLPPLIEQIRLKFNHLQVSVSDTLDGHPGLIDVLHDRFLSAIHSTKP